MFIDIRTLFENQLLPWYLYCAFDFEFIDDLRCCSGESITGKMIDLIYIASNCDSNPLRSVSVNEDVYQNKAEEVTDWRTCARMVISI